MTETWKCDIESNLQGSVDESATLDHAQRSSRGHGGSRSIELLMIPYKLIDKTINLDYRIITIKMTG